MPEVLVVVRRGSEPPEAVATEALERGWTLTPIEVDRLAAHSGRKMNMVPRTAAADLYIALHRDRCAVLSTVRSFVRTTPAGPLRDDRVIDVPTFCRYKAFTLHLDAEGASSRWVAGFEEWLASSGCDGHSDPRCLPFHTFKAKGTYDLEELSQRKAFERDHRSRRSRIDDRRLTWSPARPGARHGREPIAVAGTQLVDGFHWDVQASRATTLATADTLWRVKGYMNIYPDGAARGGKHSPLEWSRRDSARADERDRN